MLNHALLFEIPWTVAGQAPLCMGFPRQECWSGLPSPGDLPEPRVEPAFSALQADSLMLHPKHRIRVSDKKEKPRTHNHCLLSAQSYLWPIHPCSLSPTWDQRCLYLLLATCFTCLASAAAIHTAFPRTSPHLAIHPAWFFLLKKGLLNVNYKLALTKNIVNNWTAKAFAVCLHGDWTPCRYSCWPSTTPEGVKGGVGTLCSRESGGTGL